MLKRHGLNTRAKRLGLVASYSAPPEPSRPEPQPERHLEASRAGELVQFDCFHVGWLSGTNRLLKKGVCDHGGAVELVAERDCDAW